MILFQLPIGLLTAVAFLLGVVHISGTGEACSYPECVFEGIPKRSGVEYYIVLLNINKIPEDIREQCSILLQRSQNCSLEYAGCPTEVTLEYSDRFDDPAYVHFIMTLGDEICGNLDTYLKLKDCFTDKLQTDLKKYINEKGYDIPRLRNTFLESNCCSDEQKAIFLDLFDNWLVHNPYQRPTSKD